jgi:hypothetical protein
MTPQRNDVRGRVRELYRLRNHYDAAASARKLELLGELCATRLRNADDLRTLHIALCFLRAFPDGVEHWRLASGALESFDRPATLLPRGERDRLQDSGIAGTTIFYRFSFAVARWLAARCPGAVRIDWDDVDAVERLDELIESTLHGSEDEYFNSGWVDSREWLALARGDRTDFDWLFAQMDGRRLETCRARAYDAADVPLEWRLQDSPFSISQNRQATAGIVTRDNGMRRPAARTAKQICTPFDNAVRLATRDGRKMIDVAMASLAVRHRETYHFNYANPRDVHVTDVGGGVSVVLFGLLPEHRFPLECTMGFLLLANGVPIGYGGSSVLFRQVNTGINIFEEYRGSEAAFLWVQVMRVYHQLTGCTRFIANPYQFGAGNDEALRSGAFWFYYRLGYRPVDGNIRKLATAEWRRLRREPGFHSKLRTLRKLAGCDMHFTLPGARASELFDERWIETSSRLATQELTATGKGSRSACARQLAAELLADLGQGSFTKLSAAERRGLELLAPFVAAAHPRGWTIHERRKAYRILLAKGADSELGFARLMGANDTFLQAIRKRCRAIEP